MEELMDDNVELNASIKYYNDSASKFNEKINKFPSNIIRILFGYKKKELFTEEKIEEFEILKEK